ncbi:MAG: hypothetical protein Q8907_05885 [Bacteroidota bacterium]|nr:hypothetical protein [Bacteroidota bacterium]
MTCIDPMRPDPDKLSKIDFIWIVIILTFEAIMGILSIYWGMVISAFSLFCYGIAIVAEIIPAFQILNIVGRIKYMEVNHNRISESKQLIISGFGLYLLAAGLVAGVVLICLNGEKPDTTIPGIVISMGSLLFLMVSKLCIKRKSHSWMIINETSGINNGLYLSAILFVSCFLYEFSRITWFDALGSLVMTGFIFYKGKAAFSRAKKQGV